MCLAIKCYTVFSLDIYIILMSCHCCHVWFDFGLGLGFDFRASESWSWSCLSGSWSWSRDSRLSGSWSWSWSWTTGSWIQAWVVVATNTTVLEMRWPDSFKNSNPLNCIKTAYLFTRHVHTPEVQTTNQTRDQKCFYNLGRSGNGLARANDTTALHAAIHYLR